MKEGKIIGWDFTRYHSADGDDKSSQTAITEQIEKLEARLLEIPKLISSKKQAIARMQSDYEWLSGLSKSRQRGYEKDKGVHPHVVSANLKKKIGAMSAEITALGTEKSRIPKQLENLKGQINTLIKGESEGLSKGLDKETSKELGEIELNKQNAELAHQSKLQEIEAQKAEELAREQIEQNKGAGGANTKLIIGISITAVLIIIGIIIYRKRMSKLNIQPLKV
jgi:hypothetical protein